MKLTFNRWFDGEEKKRSLLYGCDLNNEGKENTYEKDTCYRF